MEFYFKKSAFREYEDFNKYNPILDERKTITVPKLVDYVFYRVVEKLKGKSIKLKSFKGDVYATVRLTKTIPIQRVLAYHCSYIWLSSLMKYKDVLDKLNELMGEDEIKCGVVLHEVNKITLSDTTKIDVRLNRECVGIYAVYNLVPYVFSFSFAFSYSFLRYVINELGYDNSRLLEIYNQLDKKFENGLMGLYNSLRANLVDAEEVVFDLVKKFNRIEVENMQLEVISELFNRGISIVEFKMAAYSLAAKGLVRLIEEDGKLVAVELKP